MNSREYTDGLESRSYNGLQLKHMTRDEAYQFAGNFGMNAILIDKSYPFEMKMVRLHRNMASYLRWIDDYGYFHELDDNQDIYWIGLK